MVAMGVLTIHLTLIPHLIRSKTQPIVLSRGCNHPEKSHIHRYVLPKGRAQSRRMVDASKTPSIVFSATYHILFIRISITLCYPG